MWTERQAIEIFHLHFLRSFSARVDKALFALKGGCNLRFYHRSIRYSEDMDLDIRTMAPATLRSNVETVLEAKSFRQALRAQQLELAEFSAPKQTQTTQRWKIQLRLQSLETIPTKIEFSRRALDEGVALAAVQPELIRTYRLYPVIVQHYGAAAAFAQKISALAQRTQIQARDIFDLKLLVDAGGAATPLRKKQLEQLLPRAIENAMSIGFEEFVGQVVAFLEPEHQADFHDRTSWESLQEQVVDTLRGLAP